MSRNVIECPYCKRFCVGGHFVPPSAGEPGFAACESLWERDDQNPDVKRMNEKYNRPIPAPGGTEHV